MLAEIRLPTPLYRATSEGVADDAGNVYEAGLLWPTIQRTLSNDFYGIVGSGTVSVDLQAREAGGEVDRFDRPALANPDAAAFRAVEARGVTVILRRRNRATGALVTRFTGVIQRVEHTSSGTIRLELADTLPDVFAVPYPRVRIDRDRWPTATSEALAVGLTVPLHLGQLREHTPCRQVEATERVYAHGTQRPRLFPVHRYVVSGALARVAQGDANVLPTVLALYRGMPIGAALIPPGEYQVVINRKLTAPQGVTATVVSGGTLTAGVGPTPMRVYQVTALHGAGESLGSALAIVTITAADVTAGRRAVLLTWEPNTDGTTGYAVSVGEQGFGKLLAIVPGGDAATFLDDGSYLGEGPYAPPTEDTTGQATVEVVFRQPQLGVDSALAPILADVATMRRAWDGPTCRSVWHLDHDTRDERPARQNPLVRATTVSLYLFERTGLDHVGAHHLAMIGLRADDYIMGPHGKPVWLANGLAYGQCETVGPNFGTGSVRLDWEGRSDPDTLERLLILAERWGSTGAHLTFRIWNGKVYGAVSDGTLIPDPADPSQQILKIYAAAGSTRLDGARHRLAMVVNRAAHTLAVYVDDVLEDSISIAGLGSLTNDGPWVVGSSSFSPGLETATFLGEMGWLRVDTDPAPFLPAGDRFDGTHADQRILQLPHTACRDLDIGSETGWTVEATIRIRARAANAQSFGLAGKRNPTTGIGWLLGLAGQSAVPGSLWSVRALLGYAGVSRVAAGGALDVGEHAVALTYQAPTPTTPGALTAVANGAVVATAALPAGAVPSIPGSSAFTLGGTGDSLVPIAPVEILEVRVTARTRTLNELAEAHFLRARNLVRQVRSLLVSGAHGPGLVLDQPSWDQAERDLAAVEAGALVTDYALVEPLPLGTHVAELLRIRGVRLYLTADGLLGCTVDQPGAVVASFGLKDGYWENLGARPTWKQTALASAFRQCRVRYRRQRSADGAIDRFVLRTSARDVHPVGRADPELLDCPALRDPVAADLFASYVAARLGLQDVAVTVPTADDEALDVLPGRRIAVADPVSGRPFTELEVRTSEEAGSVEQGSSFTFECAPASDAVYTYVPGTLPVAPDAESRPDYSATYPLRVADFAVTFSVTVALDGRRIWSALATWAKVTHENAQTLLLEWRVAGTTAWQSAGVPLTQTSARVDDVFDDATSYEFRLSAVNRFGLVGAPSLVTRATTAPGAPATPTGLTALTAGSARQRRWKWNENAEKNLKGYHWEVYEGSAMAGGVPSTPRRDRGFTRAERVTYSESDLAASLPRYCRIQAVNTSGQVSAWTVLVAAAGSTVETDDMADGAASEAYDTPETDTITEGVQVPGGFVTVGNIALTPPAGQNAIPIGTKAVRIQVEVSIRLIDWGVGGATTGTVTARLIRGGVTIGTREILAETVPAIAGVDESTRRQSYHLAWTEKNPAAAAAATYALQIQFTRSTANPPTEAHNIGVRSPKFHVTVQKR